MDVLQRSLSRKPTDISEETYYQIVQTEKSNPNEGVTFPMNEKSNAELD
jgi:hypothetical protein